VKTGKLGKGLVLQIGGLRWASNLTCKNIILAAPQIALEPRKDGYRYRLGSLIREEKKKK
jgi:hypothetical protein